MPRQPRPPYSSERAKLWQNRGYRFQHYSESVWKDKVQWDLEVFRREILAWNQDVKNYIASFGEKKQMTMVGMIGGGTKYHNLTVGYVDCPDGAGILWATSGCGSQKWNVEHPSGLSVNEAPLEQVNCDKCLGRRVVGGKKVAKQYKCSRCGHLGRRSDLIDPRNWVVRRYLCPQCGFTGRPELQSPGKRPKIDPMSRPRVFTFTWKQDEKSTGKYPGGRESIGRPKREWTKGMTEGEAWAKLEKHELSFAKEFGYTVRIYDKELENIRSYNGTILWRKGEEPLRGSSLSA